MINRLGVSWNSLYWPRGLYFDEIVIGGSDQFNSGRWRVWASDESIESSIVSFRNFKIKTFIEFSSFSNSNWSRDSLTSSNSLFNESSWPAKSVLAASVWFNFSVSSLSWVSRRFVSSDSLFYNKSQQTKLQYHKSRILTLLALSVFWASNSDLSCLFCSFSKLRFSCNSASANCFSSWRSTNCCFYLVKHFTCYCYNL